MFKIVEGNWINYRSPRTREIDLHYNRGNHGTFHENMAKNHDYVLEQLALAQREGIPSVMFIHGHSTSRPGKISTRSVVRKLMRSAEATPYIIRSECLQHDTFFRTEIRQTSEPLNLSRECRIFSQQ